VYLIQILLPVTREGSEPFPRAELDHVRRELTERFGGATAYLRAPAAGLWKDGGGDVERDDVVIVEVLAKQLEREWWRLYKEELEHRFRQEEIVVRSLRCDLL
jgi:hypothetical protein